MAPRRDGQADAAALSPRARELRLVFSEEDNQICAAMNLAADLNSPEEGEALLGCGRAAARKERGFKTERDLRIAIDAKRPRKEAPAYLEYANARTIARERNAVAMASAAANVAAAVLIPVRQAAPRPMKVIDVKDAEG